MSHSKFNHRTPHPRTVLTGKKNYLNFELGVDNYANAAGVGPIWAMTRARPEVEGEAQDGYDQDDASLYYVVTEKLSPTLQLHLRNAGIGSTIGELKPWLVANYGPSTDSADKRELIKKKIKAVQLLNYDSFDDYRLQKEKLFTEFLETGGTLSDDK